MGLFQARKPRDPSEVASKRRRDPVVDSRALDALIEAQFARYEQRTGRKIPASAIDNPLVRCAVLHAACTRFRLPATRLARLCQRGEDLIDDLIAVPNFNADDLVEAVNVLQVLGARESLVQPYRRIRRVLEPLILVVLVMIGYLSPLFDSSIRARFLNDPLIGIANASVATLYVLLGVYPLLRAVTWLRRGKPRWQNWFGASVMTGHIITKRQGRVDFWYRLLSGSIWFLAIYVSFFVIAIVALSIIGGYIALLGWYYEDWPVGLLTTPIALAGAVIPLWIVFLPLIMLSIWLFEGSSEKYVRRSWEKMKDRVGLRDGRQG